MESSGCIIHTLSETLCAVFRKVFYEVNGITDAVFIEVMRTRCQCLSESDKQLYF